MIDSVARRIAIQLKTANPEETASVEVMTYALVGILHNAITLATAFIAGLFLGRLVETILAAVTFILFRMVSAGYHFKTAIACFVFSSLIFVAIPLIPVPSGLLIYINSASLLLVMVYAPSKVKEHIRISPQLHPLLKVISAALVTIGYFLGNPVITLALFVQSLTLIHFQRKGVSK